MYPGAATPRGGEDVVVNVKAHLGRGITTVSERPNALYRISARVLEDLDVAARALNLKACTRRAIDVFTIHLCAARLYQANAGISAGLQERIVMDAYVRRVKYVIAVVPNIVAAITEEVKPGTLIYLDGVIEIVMDVQIVRGKTRDIAHLYRGVVAITARFRLARAIAVNFEATNRDVVCSGLGLLDQAFSCRPPGAAGKHDLRVRFSVQGGVAVDAH